ncbi:SMP-30/gluconolactonase/LRE family protein [Sphingomicrobium marinum]|uniref:SMP-30/gluconolactonase/LRE family protein n=1 Tax=Sphingomicrobium marinum TaxID=1227950 RepID=UPI00223F39ED|nr:hypothetical protein [Sphingomicrobium marinum]
MRFIAGALIASLLAGCGPVARAGIVVAPEPSVVDLSILEPWTPTGQAGRVHTGPGLSMLPYPNSASVQRRLLGRAFEVEEERVFAQPALQRLGAFGFALSDGAQAQLETIMPGPVMAAYRAALVGKVAPVEASDIAALIPPEFPLSESIAYDVSTSRYFSMSIADSTLITSQDAAEWHEVALAGGGRPMGLAIDASRRLLWVTMGRMGEEADAFVGLVAVDIDTLAEARRIPAAATSLNDVTVAADGSVFASDSLGGGIYRFATGAETVERLDEELTFRSPQGIALHPSGRYAYISDYSYGLALFALESRLAYRIDGPENLMLDGVDGLFLHEEHGLIAIQNGVSPHRIMAFTLSTDGTRITRATTLERAHGEWGEPTTGQLVNGALLYISNPQWDRFDENGLLQGDAPLQANIVRRLPL